MKIFAVMKPFDPLFLTALDRVATFALTTPGCSIPVEFFTGCVSKLYAERSNLMCLFLVLDDLGVAHGHCLAMIEMSFGRKLGWVYQAKMDNDIPMGERRSIIRDGLAVLKMWAANNHCDALGMATQRNLSAMGRRFGFMPTHTIMECPVEER